MRFSLGYDVNSHWISTVGAQVGAVHDHVFKSVSEFHPHWFRQRHERRHQSHLLVEGLAW